MTEQKKNNPRRGVDNTSFPDPKQIRKQAEQRAWTKKSPVLESMTREEIRQMFHEMQVKQLEAELENEQLRADFEEYTNYAALFTKIRENMLDLVILTDRSGNLKFIGESLKTLGYDSKSMIGHNMTDFVHPEDLNPVLETYADVVAGGDPHRIRFRCRRGDGSYLWVEARGTSLKDEKDNPQEIVLSLRDVTQQKFTEEALRKSEEKFRHLFERAEEGILIVRGKIVDFANPALENVLGYPIERITSEPFVTFIHPDDRETVRDLHFRMMQNEFQEKRYDFRVVTLDKTVKWVTANAQVIDWEGEQANLCFVIDISDRKQAEEKLRESEEKYRRIAENITDVVWTTDLNLNLTFVSSSIRKLLGMTPEEHMQRTMTEKHPPVYIEKIYQMLAEELEKENDPAIDKARSRLIEVEHYKADGSTIWVSMNISAIRDEYGNLVGLQGVTRDITEQKKREEEQKKLRDQLHQAQKMESVGRLAGGVAHDFNNKLTIINGYAEMAIDMMDPSDPLREMIREIQTAGKQSADIVRQLLAFARKQEISPVQLDLNDTISSMLKMLQRLIGENIDLAWHPGNNLWPVKIDPSQVDQIMANLAVNACDSIADVGKITIETKNIEVYEDYCMLYPSVVPGRYVILAVSDDGYGMEKETIENLFEPFFTTKEVGQGTGLGLATVYGIVKQNKGFINVYSEPGMGTTFKIYLPRLEAEETSLEPAIESTGQIPAGTETILIVEDEKGVLQMSKMILERRGYTVQTAGNPSDALQLAEEYNGTIHLLITDVVMPEMNGRDLASRLAVSRPRLKTLYMSGYTANAIAHNGVLDEDVLFIQKPFSMHDLAVKVGEAIEQE